MNARTASYADHWDFDMPASGTVQIDMTSSEFDTYLILTTADGTSIARNDDGGDGRDSRLREHLRAGPYRIIARGFSRSSRGSYTIEASTASAVTASAVPAGSARIQLGGRATGSLGPGDQRRDGGYADYWDFDMPASGNVQIDMTSSEFDTYLILTTADGATIARNDDGGDGRNARLRERLVAGSYRIIAKGFSDGARGSYAIAARAVSAAPPEPEVVHDVFRDCDVCPEMVVIPDGSFMMGGPGFAYAGQIHGSDVEGPIHRVTIGRPFAMGVYEVTFDEWDACVSDGGCERYSPDDYEWGRGTRPVIMVSWEDAQQYVEWLRSRTGEQYRLPSEAEWEYAARAGTTTDYSWGDALGSNRANCGTCGSRWDNERTAPVGSFAPNAFGLHDVHGNVNEWVEDCRHGSYAGAPADGSAWTDGLDCGSRVFRSGYWRNLGYVLRSAHRGGDHPIWRDAATGFRVAKTISP